MRLLEGVNEICHRQNDGDRRSDQVHAEEQHGHILRHRFSPLLNLAIEDQRDRNQCKIGGEPPERDTDGLEHEGADGRQDRPCHHNARGRKTTQAPLHGDRVPQNHQEKGIEQHPDLAGGEKRHQRRADHCGEAECKEHGQGRTENHQVEQAPNDAGDDADAAQNDQRHLVPALVYAIRIKRRELLQAIPKSVTRPHFAGPLLPNAPDEFRLRPGSAH